MIKETEWDNKKMMRSDNYKILFRTKEEKAWWTRRKLDNFNLYSKEKLDKLTISIVNSTNTREKAKKMINKSDS